MGSEHGFVGIRMLVVLASAVALVWVVPFVFLKTETTAAPGTVGATTPAEPAGAAPDAITDARGATGGTVTGDLVSDPIREANDLQAQSMLNQAIRVGQVYYAENGTFDGFGPDAAAAYDPSIVYTQGTVTTDMVTMYVSSTTVVLVTLVELNGGYLCAAAMGDIVTFGRTNATMPADCQGGWE